MKYYLALKNSTIERGQDVRVLRHGAHLLQQTYQKKKNPKKQQKKSPCRTIHTKHLLKTRRS